MDASSYPAKTLWIKDAYLAEILAGRKRWRCGGLCQYPSFPPAMPCC
jgi:hypothetical protein